MLMRSVQLGLIALFSASVYAAPMAPTVIYGEDSREDVINSDNAMYRELSLSTAAMISFSKLEEGSRGEIKISSRSLRRSMNTCSDERFAEQPTAANCSGFLVAPDILVTAGHCIMDSDDCRANAWVFDYKIEEDGQSSISVEKSKVFRCQKVIKTVLRRDDGNDYAVLKLDRPVTDREPLKFRTSGQIKKGDELVVIGHPSGLPTKIADGAAVRSLSRKFFVANLDTYGGNSGSAVFNAHSGEVEGILVRGEQDYVWTGCRRSNRVADNEGRGEDVTFITNIEEIKQYR